MMRTMQENQVDRGRLFIQVQSQSRPIEDARIEISYTGDPQDAMEQVTTDANGKTELIELAAPPLEYSMQPSEEQPYAEYTLRVTAPGYEPVTISGTEVLPDATSVQSIQMTPLSGGEEERSIVIPAHTLYGDYPPKIAEAEIKPVSQTGEIVLSRVVIPEFIVVHDGAPRDSSASDYYVRYRDYIKNVASSEIYATWPRATITANVLAIMSFTLNRVYTEWSLRIR